MKKLIDKLREERTLTSEEFAHLLSHYDDEALAYINQQAREVATAHFGQGVYIRGLIEISNYCRNNCNYCGIRKDNWRADRYRLSKEMIWDCCEHGYKLGFRSFVLQGGEDPKRSDNDMEEIIAEIRRRYPECAITPVYRMKTGESLRRIFYEGAIGICYATKHSTEGITTVCTPMKCPTKDVSNAFRNSNESVSRPGQASWWEPLTKEWNF